MKIKFDFSSITGMNKRQKLPPYQRKKPTKTVNYFTMSINATMLDLPRGMEPMEHQVAGCIHICIKHFYNLEYNKFILPLFKQNKKVIHFKWAMQP